MIKQTGAVAPLLEIRDLHVSVADQEILRGLDLTVNQGEVHAIRIYDRPMTVDELRRNRLGTD